MEPKAGNITQLLEQWSRGDERALEKLMPLVYSELHGLARRYLSGEDPGHTLQTTALVNEAYLRLVDVANPNWEGRTHFFAMCAQIMRRILVDSARSRQAEKRGKNAPKLDLEDALMVAAQPETDLVAIDEALRALAVVDARKSQVVELRFFGGLSVKETADVLKVSVDTVHRDWKVAKSWLRRELTRGDHDAGRGNYESG